MKGIKLLLKWFIFFYATNCTKDERKEILERLYEGYRKAAEANQPQVVEGDKKVFFVCYPYLNKVKLYPVQK